jgi:hypothetical protein
MGGNGGVGSNLLPFIEKFVNQPGMFFLILGKVVGQTTHEISALRAGIGHLGVNLGGDGY